MDKKTIQIIPFKGDKKMAYVAGKIRDKIWNQGISYPDNRL